MFPPAAAVRLSMNRHSTVHVSTAKSGRVPDLAVISRTYLSVLLRWGAKTSERVATSSSYTRRPLIGRQNRHCRATGGYIQTNTLPARYLWTTAKDLFIGENVGQKVSRPSWPSYIVALSLLCHILLFPWIYQQATLCRVAMR